MLVCRATISSRFRPSVSALSYVTSYPLSVFVRGTLPVPLSRQLLFRHHNRVSASLPAAASFRFDSSIRRATFHLTRSFRTFRFIGPHSPVGPLIFVDSRPVRSVSAPPFFLSLSAPVSRPRVPCAAHRRALLSGRPAVYPAEAPVCRRPQLRPGSISSSDRAQHMRHSRSLDQEKA